MSRLWPWSSGAPVESEHSELEEQMSPNPQGEGAAYDMKPAAQATAGKAGAPRQAGADSQRRTLQQG